jgi:hypothetical protein
MDKKDAYLRDLYYNPKSSVAFSGIDKIWQKIKEKIPVKLKEAKDFLQEQPTYTLHKRVIKKFTFRKTMVSYSDQQWQADLVDMQKYKNYNDYNYILTVIDLLSRYAWVKKKRRSRS